MKTTCNISLDIENKALINDKRINLSSFVNNLLKEFFSESKAVDDKAEIKRLQAKLALSNDRIIELLKEKEKLLKDKEKHDARLIHFKSG